MSTTFKISAGDITINNITGRPNTISDEQKLRQDISEFFTIYIQPNGFGAGLEQLIGVVEVSPAMFTSLAHKQIADGFNVFKFLQQSEPRIPRVVGERIAKISYLAVEADPSDPTRYFFRANIVTEKGIELPFTNVFTV